MKYLFRLLALGVVALVLIEIGFRLFPKAMPDVAQYNFSVQYYEARTLLAHIDRFKTNHSKPRVLLVGDSFTRCAEVGYKDGWTYKLKKAFPAAEFINASIGGLGPVATVHRTQTLWADVPLDVVALSLNAMDFDDNVQEEDELSRGDTARMLDASPYLGGLGKMGMVGYYFDLHSITYRLLKWIAKHEKTEPAAEDVPDLLYRDKNVPEIFRRGPPSKTIQPQVAIMDRAIARLAAFCRQKNARLVVQYLPYKNQVYLTSYQDYSPQKHDLYGPNKWVKDICAKNGAVFLDATPTLIEHKDGAVYRGKGHMSETGQQWVATYLIRAWTDENILPHGH